MREPTTEAEALAALRGRDPARAARAEAFLWALWCRAATPELDALMRRGLAAMERRDLETAGAVFGDLIRRAPEYAEGWNKRATVRYLADDYAGSIADCREVLARKPYHFGALSGLGLCHMALGEHREAAAMFRRALEVHPHLTAVRTNLRAALSEVVKFN
jgi:tetratricopeptide (TPR) repeat protein